MDSTGWGIISNKTIWLPSGRELTSLCASQLISSSEADAAGETASQQTSNKPKTFENVECRIKAFYHLYYPQI